MINALVNLGIMERKMVNVEIKGKERTVSAIRFSRLDWNKKRNQMIQMIRTLAGAERMISLGVGFLDGIPEVGALPADFAQDNGTP